MHYPAFPPRIPLIWRANARLQLGLTPTHFVDAAPRQLPDALRLCDGRTNPRSIAELTGVPVTTLERALRRCVALAPPANPAALVTVVGTGLLAARVSEALAPHPSVGADTVYSSINTGVVVFATESGAVPRDFLRRCADEQRTLIPVVSRPEGVDVGPVVSPHLRGCPMCEEFAAATHDNERASVGEQLSRQLLPMSASEAAFAAGLVAGAVDCLVRGRESDLHGVVWGLTNSRLHRRELVPHESCPCSTSLGHVPALRRLAIEHHPKRRRR